MNPLKISLNVNLKKRTGRVSNILGFIEGKHEIKKKEIDLIRRALEKHNGKRKNASEELGISERTLYRKIKEYNIK